MTGVHRQRVLPGRPRRVDGPGGRRSRSRSGRRADVTLEWATYYDAADQAGPSRLYGGIHISADDLNGRMIGSECGTAALAMARHYYDGTAGPDAVGAQAGSAVSRRLRVGLAVGAVVVGVAGRRCCRRWLLTRTPTPTVGAPARRASSTRRPRRGSSTRTAAATRPRSAAGSPSSTATTTARPDLFVAGGDRPAALFRNESAPSAARRGSRGCDDPVTELDGVTGAYPLDIDADGHADLAVLRDRRDRRSSGASATAGSSSANEALGLDGVDGVGDRLQRDVGGRMRLPDARGRALPRRSTTRARRSTSAPTTTCIRPRRHDVRGPRARSIPGTARCRCCSATGTAPDGATCGSATTASTTTSSTARSSCGGSRPARRRVLYTADDGWVQMQIWGMGIASHDLTGDGLPEVYLTSQADNKLQTLAAGPAQPMYRDIALKRGVIGTRPVNGGDPLPSTAWHPAFEDVNNDGFIDLYVSKGNVAKQAGYATRDPSNLFIGQPDGTFVEQAEAAGIVELRSRAWLRARRPRPGRPAGPRGGEARRAGAGLAQRRGPGLGRRAGADGTLARHPAAPARVEPGRDRRRGRGRHRRCARASGDSSSVGGHISGQLGPVHVGLGAAGQARVRVTWPDGEQGPGCRSTRTRSVLVERGGRRRRGRPSRAAERRSRRMTTRTTRDDRSARLRDAGRSPGAPGRPLRGARRGAARAGATRGASTALVVYADREHSANIAFLTGLRPAVRGGAPRHRAGRPAGDPRGQRVPAARPPRRRCRCGPTGSRTSACRCSRATGRSRSPTSWRGRGSGAAAGSA